MRTAKRVGRVVRSVAGGARVAVRAVGGRAGRVLPGRLRPRWWPLPAGALIGLAFGLGYGLLAAPVYAADAYVVVRPVAGGDYAAALGATQAYGRIAADPAVLARAGVDPGRVRTATSPDAAVVEITGSAPRPGEAARVADAVARALTEMGNEVAGATGAELTPLGPAAAAGAAVSPEPGVSAAVGLCTGGLAGGMLTLLRPGRRTAGRSEAERGAATGR